MDGKQALKRGFEGKVLKSRLFAASVGAEVSWAGWEAGAAPGPGLGASQGPRVPPRGGAWPELSWSTTEGIG